MIPITIDNNTYASVIEAWRQASPEGLTIEAVRWRLREGWSAKDAITTPVVMPENRRGFKDLRESSAVQTS